MTINWIFAGVIIFILGRLGVQLYLERKNRTWTQQQGKVVPENLKEIVTPEAHAKSAEYRLAHGELTGQELIFGALIKIMILSCGLLPFVYNGTLVNFGGGNFFAQALMMGLMGVLISILYWPFDWVSNFVIEAKYGFNRQTPWLWLSDNLKSIIIGLVLTVPLTAVILWMASGGVRNWWVMAFIVVMIYEIVLTFVYPAYIEPLFNKFEPLPQGDLRNRLEALASRAGVNVSKILVMDESKRSSHGNAYFAGIGENRRIVLYDTLLQQLSPAEVEAVLAHEIGHMKHQHTLRGMYVGGALQLFGFFIANAVISWDAFYHAFGFVKGGGVAGAFWVMSLVGGAFAFWLTPVMARWHRAHEYEADAYAAKLTGSPVGLVGGLKKMHKESLGSVEDAPIVQAFYASHPTLREREEALRSANKKD